MTGKDLTGSRFTRLLVVAEAPSYRNPTTGKKARKWHCVCDCGNRTTVLQARLIAGRTNSCGCLRSEAVKKRRVTLTPGALYGRLTVIEEATPKALKDNKRSNRWLCECECGARLVVRQSSLRSGDTRSCGCSRRWGRSKVGLSNHPLYQTWSNAMQRCMNPRSHDYRYYGGRGIEVCDRWRASPEAFIADILNEIGERPAGWQLDRIDNARGYEPGNVRWATPSMNCRNRRSNRVFEFRGEMLSLAGIAERVGLNYTTLHSRLRLGWDFDQAVIGEKHVQI